MLQTRRSLSISSNEPIHQELASSQSGVSLGSGINDNIDLEETEQSLIEVKMLQKHIAIFDGKVDRSEKVLNKKLQE